MTDAEAVLKHAATLHEVLHAAWQADLPIPFHASATEYAVAVQFHTHADAEKWLAWDLLAVVADERTTTPLGRFVAAQAVWPDARVDVLALESP